MDQPETEPRQPVQPVDIRQLVIPSALVGAMGVAIWTAAAMHANMTAKIDQLVNEQTESRVMLNDIRDTTDRLERTQAKILDRNALPRAEFDGYMREFFLLNTDLRQPKR